MATHPEAFAPNPIVHTDVTTVPEASTPTEQAGETVAVSDDSDDEPDGDGDEAEEMTPQERRALAGAFRVINAIMESKHVGSLKRRTSAFVGLWWRVACLAHRCLYRCL